MGVNWLFFELSVSIVLKRHYREFDKTSIACMYAYYLAHAARVWGRRRLAIVFSL